MLDGTISLVSEMESGEKVNIWQLVPLGVVAFALLSYYAWTINRPNSTRSGVRPSGSTESSTDTTKVLAIAQQSGSPVEEMSQAMAAGDEVRCAYTRKSVCNSATGCSDSPIGQSYLLMPGMAQLEKLAHTAEPSTVRRCDEQGCSAVDVIVSANGEGYLALSAGDRGYLVKMARTEVDGGAGAFVEVATLGLTSLTYFGRCRA